MYERTINKLMNECMLCVYITYTYIYIYDYVSMYLYTYLHIYIYVYICMPYANAGPVSNRPFMDPYFGHSMDRLSSRKGSKVVSTWTLGTARLEELKKSPKP